MGCLPSPSTSGGLNKIYLFAIILLYVLAPLLNWICKYDWSALKVLCYLCNEIFVTKLWVWWNCVISVEGWVQAEKISALKFNSNFLQVYRSQSYKLEAELLMLLSQGRRHSSWLLFSLYKDSKLHLFVKP